MCILFVSIHPLIFCSNRDEFTQRETIVAHAKNFPSNIFAGLDLLAGGTWLGVDIKTSKIYIAQSVCLSFLFSFILFEHFFFLTIIFIFYLYIIFEKNFFFCRRRQHSAFLNLRKICNSTERSSKSCHAIRITITWCASSSLATSSTRSTANGLHACTVSL